MGFSVLGLTMDSSANGATSLAASDGLRSLTSFVGHLGPSAFGLGAAKLIETRHVVGPPE